MAKRRKKKVVPVIRKQRRLTIETDDFQFWIECKSVNKAKIIPLMSELSVYGDPTKLKEEDIDASHAVKMLPMMVDAVASCITDWEIEAEVSEDSINELPLDVQMAIISQIMSAGDQEKN